MVEFAGYIFDDHKASFVCNHVLDGQPILLFVHDRDGDIQFMCGAIGHTPGDLHVIGVGHLRKQLRSMADIPVVDPGFLAERGVPGGGWQIQPLDD